MALLVIALDQKQPDTRYEALHHYQISHNSCSRMKSMWFIETLPSPGEVLEGLRALVQWSSFNFDCATWLNNSKRQ